MVVIHPIAVASPRPGRQWPFSNAAVEIVAIAVIKCSGKVTSKAAAVDFDWFVWDYWEETRPVDFARSKTDNGLRVVVGRLPIGYRSG